MHRKFLKEFLFYPDVLLMTLILLTFFTYMSFHISLTTLVSFLTGIIAYTVMEYFTHRFLFHSKPPNNPFLFKLMKRLHYDHHHSPNDLHLLFLPLWFSLPNIVIIGAITYFVTSNIVITISFLAGVITLLLYYELVHYIAHRPFQPKTPWGKWMKKVHIWHHYKNENYWFGVTNPGYDMLLGTFKDQKDVEKSETAKQLDKK